LQAYGVDMLDELDATLAALLKKELPPEVGQVVTIDFANPGASYPPQDVKLPLINFFLYDAQESVVERNVTPLLQRSGSRTVLKVPPPVRMKCCYLVSAWTNTSAEGSSANEHALLGAVMKVLLGHPVLPTDVLQGGLQNTGGPPPSRSLEPAMLRSPADTWQAMGGRPKLSFNYSVSFEMPVMGGVEVPVVTEKVLKMRSGTESG
jgi:hypothetical protein